MTSSKSRVPLVLAILSVVLTPFLWIVQFFGLWIDGVEGLVLVAVPGALTLLLPLWAFVAGRKAKAKAPQIIGGIVGAICLVVNLGLVLTSPWVVSLSCFLFAGC
jgi:hypothetical protein